MLNIIKSCLEYLGMSLNKLILTEGICTDGNLPPGLPPRLDVLNGRSDFTKYMATAWNTWEECPTAILSVKTKSKTISVQSACVSIAKYHKWDGLNNRNVFSHISHGQKSEMRVLCMVVFAESSLQVADGNLLIDDQLLMEGCLMVVSSHGRERERSAARFSFIRTPIPLDPGATLMASINLSHLLKGFISKYSDIGG